MSSTYVFTVGSAILLLLFVLELVRRRRLREEYSWLWLFASATYLFVVAIPPLSRWVADLLGTSNTALTFIFISLMFVVLILIQFSVRLSKLTNQIKDMAQHLAIIDSEQRKTDNDLRTGEERFEGEYLEPELNRSEEVESFMGR